MESTVEQTIAGIKARNIELSVNGDKIVSSEPLSPDEKEKLKTNRAEAIALIAGTVPETPEAAYARGHSAGYALGIQHATEELASRAPVAAPPPAPRVTTPDEEIERFQKWLGGKSEYYRWEIECIEALRAALVPGERIHPMFAYSCIIIGVDGKEREFQRRPSKKK